MDTANVSASNWKGNVTDFEMSRYIDLDIYHTVEQSHPFYIEMTEAILARIEEFQKGKKEHLEILELGSGTGLFTAEVAKLPGVNVSAVEIDQNCFEVLDDYVQGNASCIQADAVTYLNPGYFDIVVSTFAHDHIHFDAAGEFVNNIRGNLKKGGLYIMGGEILPFYETESERQEALQQYHGYIVETANRQKNFLLAQIEISALQSGVEMVGDFKRHEQMFEEEMLTNRFELVEKNKIGPSDRNDVGGVFVYAFSAV